MIATFLVDRRIVADHDLSRPEMLELAHAIGGEEASLAASMSVTTRASATTTSSTATRTSTSG